MKVSSSGRACAPAWLCALLVGGLSTVGCAITDAGHPAVGGDSGVGANNGASGGGASASGGAGTDGACEAGSRRCAGDTPQTCQSDGSWQAEAPCKADQACSGAGVCAAFRLVQAGINTFAEQPAPAEGAPLVLKEQTLMAAPRACATNLCITGDLR
jgi:hypothetical protein